MIEKTIILCTLLLQLQGLILAILAKNANFCIHKYMYSLLHAIWHAAVLPHDLCTIRARTCTKRWLMLANWST